MAHRPPRPECSPATAPRSRRIWAGPVRTAHRTLESAYQPPRRDPCFQSAIPIHPARQMIRPPTARAVLRQSTARPTNAREPRESKNAEADRSNERACRGARFSGLRRWPNGRRAQPDAADQREGHIIATGAPLWWAASVPYDHQRPRPGRRGLRRAVRLLRGLLLGVVAYIRLRGLGPVVRTLGLALRRG